MKLTFEKYFSDDLKANDWLLWVMNSIVRSMFKAKFEWCKDSEVKSTEAFNAAFDDSWNKEFDFMLLKEWVKAEFLKLYLANGVKLTPELEDFYKKYYGIDDED